METGAASVRIAAVPAKIQIRHHTNSSMELHHSAWSIAYNDDRYEDKLSKRIFLVF